MQRDKGRAWRIILALLCGQLLVPRNSLSQSPSICSIPIFARCANGQGFVYTSRSRPVGEAAVWLENGGIESPIPSTGLDGLQVLGLAMSGDRLLAATWGDGVWCLDCGVDGWTKFSDGIPSHRQYIRCMAVAPTSGTVYAADQRGFVYSLAPKAVSWRELGSRGLEVGTEQGIRFLHVDAKGHLYAGIVGGDGSFGGAIGGLYLHRDSPQSDNWNRVQLLSGVYPQCIAETDGALYLGTNRGLFRLKDATDEWVFVDGTTSNVKAMAADGIGGLYLAAQQLESAVSLNTTSAATPYIVRRWSPGSQSEWQDLAVGSGRVWGLWYCTEAGNDNLYVGCTQLQVINSAEASELPRGGIARLRLHKASSSVSVGSSVEIDLMIENWQGVSGVKAVLDVDGDAARISLADGQYPFNQPETQLVSDNQIVCEVKTMGQNMQYNPTSVAKLVLTGVRPGIVRIGLVASECQLVYGQDERTIDQSDVCTVLVLADAPEAPASQEGAVNYDRPILQSPKSEGYVPRSGDFRWRSSIEPDNVGGLFFVLIIRPKDAARWSGQSQINYVFWNETRTPSAEAAALGNREYLAQPALAATAGAKFEWAVAVAHVQGGLAPVKPPHLDAARNGCPASTAEFYLMSETSEWRTATVFEEGTGWSNANDCPWWVPPDECP